MQTFVATLIALVLITTATGADDPTTCTNKHPNGLVKWAGARVTVYPPEGWTTDRVYLTVWDNEQGAESDESCTAPLWLTRWSEEVDTLWGYGSFATSCSDSNQPSNSGQVELYEKIQVNLKTADGKDCKVFANYCLPEREEGEDAENYIEGELDLRGKTPSCE